MIRVADVLEALERIAPCRWAFDYDNVGLLVGTPDDVVTQGVVALDPSPGAMSFASGCGAELLICHHPVIWDPIRKLDGSSFGSKMALRLARADLSMIACHTNWDSAPGGINDTLCERLGLEIVSEFGEAGQGTAFAKLVVFVPPTRADSLLDALSAAGAGVIGNYERCAYLSSGTGTFFGKEGTNPAVGSSGQVENVEETRLEMRLPASRQKEVSEALLAAHPYEEPAYDFYPLVSAPEQPSGRIGELRTPLTVAEFRELCDRRLDTRTWAWGDPTRTLSKIAVVGGAADRTWRAARESGAEALLTGEVRQDVAVDAMESRFALFAAGHYATENPGMAALAVRLRKELPAIEWVEFEPEPGFDGRPF